MKEFLFCEVEYLKAGGISVHKKMKEFLFFEVEYLEAKSQLKS